MGGATQRGPAKGFQKTSGVVGTRGVGPRRDIGLTSNDDPFLVPTEVGVHVGRAVPQCESTSAAIAIVG